MRKNYTLVYFSLILNFIFINKSYSQTATTTITYGGFQACGGCTVCGADYWCFNTPGSYCGNTAPCSTSTFIDPVPPGNIVTNISINYFSASCAGGGLTATINGNTFPTVYEGNTGCLCSSFPCGVAATTSSTFPCGIPGYNYGGVNNFQICTGNDVCINRIEITMTYVPSNQAVPANQPGAISGNSTPCIGTVNTYSISAVANATSYTWTVPSGWTINSGQGTTSISVTAGANPGNICVTASNLCGTSTPACFPVTSITAPAQPAPITGSTSVCAGQNLTYSISAVSGATSYNWTVPAGWTINSGQGTTSINVTAGSSTGNICVTASNACGTSPSRCLAVTIGSPPATPGAISGNNPACPNSSNTYSISAISGATSYTWTVPAGWTINSGQGTTSITTTAGTSGGNICVTASNGCGTSSAQCINITMNSNSSPPTSATANPSVICVGNSTTLTVNGGSLGTGAQWQWYSGSCGGTLVGTGNSISVSPTNTTTYFVRAAGTCNTTTCASVTVTVDQNPASSNAGPNQSICGLTTTLSGNTPSLGTGTWSQISGPGTISFNNVNSPTTSVTASVYGTYVLQWTINNGSCSTSSTVSITFDEMPIPSAAGNDAAVCGLSINLNGNNPNIGVGNWTMQSGPGTITFGSASSPTTSATASAYGTYTLTWTFTNGACSNNDNVNITFDEMPNTADAGLDDAICGLTISLNANTANIGTATWSQVSGPGTLLFSNINSNVSSVTASTYGTYTASWTITNGVCSTTDNVTLTFDEMPNAANAGADDSICGLNTVLSGVAPNIGTLTWTQINGPGTTTFSNANQHNTPINVTTSGLYDYALTIVNGTCVTSDTVSYNFFDAPSPVDAGVDTAVCALSLNLNAQNPTIGTATWTQIGGPSIATIANNTSINTQVDVSQYGTYTLLWTVINGACTLYDTLNVRFDQTPSAAYAGIDTTICTNEYILEGNEPTIGNGVWTSLIGGITMSDSTSNINPISSLAVGINTFIWTISNGVCPASHDTVIITVNPSSIIPDFTTDTNEIYAYQIVSFIDLSTGNPNTWHWNFGDGDTSVIQNPGHIYTDIGIYPVMLVITNALGCRDTIIKDIEVKERFLVPNVFTPNNDGINDVFKVIASGYKDFSMQIYNRFGQVIFESFNPTIGWNGKTAAELDVTVGTYFYVIKAVAPDGKEIIEKGPVQLLR